VDETQDLLGSHKELAIQANGKTWALLEKPARTEVEDLELIESAYTSLYHWRAVGTIVNIQRGHWLLARVMTVLKIQSLTLSHAQTCMQITLANPKQMADFDVAYASEGMARVLALHDDREKALKYHQQAKELGSRIQDAEDRRIFLDDFNGGDWFGL